MYLCILYVYCNVRYISIFPLCKRNVRHHDVQSLNPVLKRLNMVHALYVLADDLEQQRINKCIPYTAKSSNVVGKYYVIKERLRCTKLQVNSQQVIVETFHLFSLTFSFTNHVNDCVINSISLQSSVSNLELYSNTTSSLDQSFSYFPSKCFTE